MYQVWADGEARGGLDGAWAVWTHARHLRQFPYARVVIANPHTGAELLIWERAGVGRWLLLSDVQDVPSDLFAASQQHEDSGEIRNRTGPLCACGATAKRWWRGAPKCGPCYLASLPPTAKPWATRKDK